MLLPQHHFNHVWILGRHWRASVLTPDRAGRKQIQNHRKPCFSSPCEGLGVTQKATQETLTVTTNNQQSVRTGPRGAATTAELTHWKKYTKTNCDNAGTMTSTCSPLAAVDQGVLIQFEHRPGSTTSLDC